MGVIIGGAGMPLGARARGDGRKDNGKISVLFRFIPFYLQFILQFTVELLINQGKMNNIYTNNTIINRKSIHT